MAKCHITPLEGEIPIRITTHAGTARIDTSSFPPHAIRSPSVFITISIDHGDDVYVDFLKDSSIVGRVC